MFFSTIWASSFLTSSGAWSWWLTPQQAQSLLPHQIALSPYSFSIDLKSVIGVWPYTQLRGWETVYSAGVPWIMSIPPLPQVEVEEYEIAWFTLYQKNDSWVPTLFWGTPNVINVDSWIPPFLLDTTTQYGEKVYSCWLANFIGGTLTTWVDGAAEWFLDILFPNPLSEQPVSWTPFFTFDWANIVATNFFFVAGGAYFVWDEVELGALNGMILPDAWDVDLVVGSVDDLIWIFPRTAQIKKVLAIFTLQNNTGSDFEFGVDWPDFTGLDVTQIICLTEGNFIGEFADENTLNSHVLFDGWIAKFLDSGSYKIRLNGTWENFWWGGPTWNTITATSWYDFSQLGRTVVPVQIRDSDWYVVPINENYKAIQETINSNTSYVRVKQVAINPQTVLYISQDSSDNLWATIIKYDIDTGRWRNASAGSTSFVANVDETIPFSVKQARDDKVVVWFVDTSGSWHIALLQVNDLNASLIRDQTIVANTCGEIQVMNGCRSASLPNLSFITFVYGDTTTLSYRTGWVQVDKNWAYVTQFGNEIGGMSPIAYTAWTPFSCDGGGYRTQTTGWYLALSFDNIYFDIPTGAIIATNAPSPSLPWLTDIICKNIDGYDNRRAIWYMFSTYEIRWTTTNFDWVNVNRWPLVLAVNVDFDRVTTRGAFDMNPEPNSGVCHFSTVLDDGSSTTLVQYLLEMPGWTLPSSIVFDTNNVSFPQAAWYKNISVVRFRRFDIGSWSQINLSFAWIDSSKYTQVFQLWFGYDNTISQNRFMTNFLAQPQFEKCIGVIAGAGSVNNLDTVTVYLNGSIAPSSFVINNGQKLYATAQWLALTNGVSPLELWVVTPSWLAVDIKPTLSTSYNKIISFDESVFEPYGTVFVEQLFDLNAISPDWLWPITFQAWEFGRLSIPNISGTWLRGGSLQNLAGLDVSIPFYEKWDTIVVVKDRDSAWNKWDVLSADGIGYTQTYDLSLSNLFSANTITMPFPYKNSTEFSLVWLWTEVIDEIIGFDVGHKFKMTWNSAVTINLVPWGSGANKIVSNSRRPSIVLPNSNTYIVCQVLDNREIQLIEYVSDGEIINLEATAEAKITLNSSDILALNTSPFQLLPAPWLWKAYNITNVYSRLRYGTVAYASNIQMAVVYAGIGYSQWVFWNANLLAETTTIMKQFTVQSGVIVENAALNLTTNTGNPTTWDWELDMYITYKVIDL